MKLSRRTSIEQQKTARVALRRQVALTGFAMMSILILSQGYGARAGIPPTPEQPATPNPPSVPAVSVTPTDTSVLAQTSAASLDAGDTHDSTMWRIRKASDATLVWADTTADSLTSWRGNGAGYTIPLQTDTLYNIDAQHHGSVSGAWSGFGTATQFTASAADPGVFLFHSDWSTCTGETLDCLIDADKALSWSGRKGDGVGETVVEVDPTDLFPTTNVLRISHVPDGGLAGVRLDSTFFGLGPTANTIRAYRGYFQYVALDSVPTARHPSQDGVGGTNTNWEFNVSLERAGGVYTPFYDMANSECAGCGGGQYKQYTPGGGTITSASTPIFYVDSVYRFEHWFAVDATGDSLTFRFNTYDRHGNNICDTTCWQRVNGDVPIYQSTKHTIPNPTQFGGLQVGINGQGQGVTSVTYTEFRWGGYAVCSDWCGPYADGR